MLHEAEYLHYVSVTAHKRFRKRHTHSSGLRKSTTNDRSRGSRREVARVALHRYRFMLRLEHRHGDNSQAVPRRHRMAWAARAPRASEAAARGAGTPSAGKSIGGRRWARGARG